MLKTINNTIKKNRFRAQTSATQFFNDESHLSQIQSRYQEYKVLKEEAHIPKWVLIDALNEACVTINIGDPEIYPINK